MKSKTYLLGIGSAFFLLLVPFMSLAGTVIPSHVTNFYAQTFAAPLWLFFLLSVTVGMCIYPRFITRNHFWIFLVSIFCAVLLGQMILYKMDPYAYVDISIGVIYLYTALFSLTAIVSSYVGSKIPVTKAIQEQTYRIPTIIKIVLTCAMYTLFFIIPFITYTSSHLTNNGYLPLLIVWAILCSVTYLMAVRVLIKFFPSTGGILPPSSITKVSKVSIVLLLLLAVAGLVLLDDERRLDETRGLPGPTPVLDPVWLEKKYKPQADFQSKYPVLKDKLLFTKTELRASKKNLEALSNGHAINVSGRQIKFMVLPKDEETLAPGTLKIVKVREYHTDNLKATCGQVSGTIIQYPFNISGYLVMHTSNGEEISIIDCEDHYWITEYDYSMEDQEDNPKILDNRVFNLYGPFEK